MPKSVPVLAGVVQSIEDCKDCQGLKKIHAMTKNRKNINATINRHRYEVHGIPIPQQQQQRPSKKPKKSKPSSDEESDDGTIDGFVF